MPAENKVPCFGICLGMQTAPCIEFARDVCGLGQADSSGVLDTSNATSRNL